jgi:hypothetical protein
LGDEEVSLHANCFRFFAVLSGFCDDVDEVLLLGDEEVSLHANCFRLFVSGFCDGVGSGSKINFIYYMIILNEIKVNK